MAALFQWPGAQPRYYVDGETVYEYATGRPALYIDGRSAYSFDGKPAFWIESQYLHDGGPPSLYFGEDV